MALIISFCIILVLVTIDQITKIFLSDYSFVYIKNFLENYPILNDGAAFSILSGQQVFFILFTIIFCVILFYFLISDRISSSNFFKYSLAVLLGGVIGNLIDRYFFEAVRDFWYVVPFNFVCNFADVAICVGTALICIYIVFIHDRHKVKEKTKKMLANSENNSENKTEESVKKEQKEG